MNLNEKLTCVIMTNIRVLSSFVCIFTFVYSSNLVNYSINLINCCSNLVNYSINFINCCSNLVNYTLNFLENNKNDVFIIMFSVLLGIYSLNNTFVKYKMSRDVM
jgi:hypothetical protein